MLHVASCKGLSPAMVSLSSNFHSLHFLQSRSPTTPTLPQQHGFGLFPGRSPLLGESLLFSLPTGTKMFQFPAFAFRSNGMTGLQPAGLSHSEIRGSMVICTYPRLIAAYHVLHRLQEPRHPPYALSYLPAAPEGAVSAGGLYFVYLFCCDRFVDNKLLQNVCLYNMSKIHVISFRDNQVENNGFEPLTPCLQSRCSSQLS